MKTFVPLLAYTALFALWLVVSWAIIGAPPPIPFIPAIIAIYLLFAIPLARGWTFPW